MTFLKKIQNKPVSTRYIILIASVSFVMIFILYFWFISFNDYLNRLTQENVTKGENSESTKNFKLLSLKESLKASVSDFIDFIYESKDKINNLNDQKKIPNSLKKDQSQKRTILKFPDNY